MTEQYLELVTKEGGSVENTDIWGRRKLAYEIDGKTEGNYVVVNYTTTPEVSAELDRVLNLNRSWVQKQGDFFVESPIILFAAVIWFLRIYDNGRYCTFPHAIEFLNKRYEDIFPILTSYPELENYLSPFMDAWLGGAQDQLQGQIASAKIPLSRMISPQLYWVMSGDDFTLDINNPDDPKILCVGNNPDRQNIYGAALGLYNSRIVKLINKKGQLKSGIIIDELPTIYFKIGRASCRERVLRLV